MNVKGIQINSTNWKREAKMCTLWPLQCNLKLALKFIGTLICPKMKGQTCATKIVLNNEIFVKKSDIADQCNQCFVNVGPKLASPVSDGDSDPSYI